MIDYVNYDAIKAELASMKTQDVWDVVRRSILHTHECLMRYVYALEELRKRGYNV